MAELNLSGKVAIVTGGANGIGAGIVTMMSDLGARVVVADVDDETGVALADRVGGEYQRLDVTDPEANRVVIDGIVKSHGRLDIAVLNAGVTGGVSVDRELDPSAYRRLMAINLDGVVYGMAHAFSAIAESGGGDIIATASMAGIAPTPFESLYAASKTAVVGLVRSFGLASIHQGVRVNAVCPAFADTALIADVASGLTAAGVPLLQVPEVVTAYREILASGDSAQCWFVQPGRPVEQFKFRNAPGPRTPEGAQAAAADPEVQMSIERQMRNE